MSRLPRSSSALRGRRRSLALVVTGAICLCLGGLAASFLIKSPAERAAETSPPARSLLTEKVTQRVVQDSVILQGDVISGRQTTVSPQSSTGSGVTPVITAVRAKPGATVRSGQVLAEVSARPVFVLPGSIPVYRDLKPDDDGKDVRQLQTALKRLGYSLRGDRLGHFGSGTRRAVSALYAHLGYDIAAAGTTADLDAARSALRQAQRTYNQLRAGGTSGGSADGASSESAGGASGGSADGGAGAADESRSLQLKYAREDRDQAQTDLNRALAKAGAMVPAAEVIFLPTLPARVVSVNAEVGHAVASDMMMLSSGRLQILARLLPYQRQLVKKGQQVQIFSDDTGSQYSGVISSIGAAPVTDNGDAGGSGGSGGSGDDSGGSGGSGQGGGSGDGGTGELYYPVTITSSKALNPSLQGLSVRVTVRRDASAGAVLAVPAAAVSSQADGASVVTVRSAGGLTTVPVTVGTTGDGYVEVTAAGGRALRVGDDVVVGR